MATIVDVARLAGVSTSTVSHVVNGTRPVSEVTRQQVLDAIEVTGYRQDTLARSLRRARTDSLGLVVSDVGQPVFADMVRGVEHEATAAGYTLLLANSGEQPEREARSLHALVSRKVDGLIVAPVAHSVSQELAAMRSHGTPVVLMDRLGGIRTDQVGVENTAPLRDLVLHMIGHGHRRIALAAGDLAVPTMAERHQGYLEALEDAGIEPDPRLVVTGPGLADDTRAAVRALLEGPDRAPAVIASSTETATGVLQAAADLGLRIPDDLRFATFDGFPHVDLVQPRITTITQPAFEIGSTAMQLLLRRLNDGKNTKPKTIRLKPTTTYRNSCGCAN
jgi:LacI family transcriptional regulator